MTCKTMKGHRIQEQAEWRREHAPHGEPVKSYPEPQPPSYRIAWLTCPCGAVNVGVEYPEDEEIPDGRPPFTRAEQEGLSSEADYWEGVIKGDA